MANYILQKELAVRASVSPATVSTSVHKKLRAAVKVMRDGRNRRVKMIDADHPATIKFIADQAQRRLKTGAPPHTPQKPPTTPTLPAATNGNGGGYEYPPLPDFDPNEDIRDFMDWPLSRIVSEFGTDERFKTWLTATKILVEIHAKNLQSLDKEGVTIDRDLVRQHIFGSINDSNQRLLIDAPKTIARRIVALANSGGTIEDAEKIIREVVAKQLRNAQQQALRLLSAVVEQNGGGNLT